MHTPNWFLKFEMPTTTFSIRENGDGAREMNETREKEEK